MPEESALEANTLSSQVGLGVDIVEIDRMRTILARTPSFREKVFSDAERAYCDATANPAVHYATRFAAKEAVVKALGTGFSEGVGVRELPISLSYTHTEAVACAMAITEESARARAERADPTEELAKQFKEARALLDGLPNGPAGGARRGSPGE